MDCILRIEAEFNRLERRLPSAAFEMAIIERALRFLLVQLQDCDSLQSPEVAREAREACREALEALAALSAHSA